MLMLQCHQGGTGGLPPTLSSYMTVSGQLLLSGVDVRKHVPVVGVVLYVVVKGITN